MFHILHCVVGAPLNFRDVDPLARVEERRGEGPVGFSGAAVDFTTKRTISLRLVLLVCVAYC